MYFVIGNVWLIFGLIFSDRQSRRVRLLPHPRRQSDES